MTGIISEWDMEVDDPCDDFVFGGEINNPVLASSKKSPSASVISPLQPRYSNRNGTSAHPKEAAKRLVLVEEAIVMIFNTQGSCGTQGFRSARSPVIQRAAYKAFERNRGRQMFPWMESQGTPFCACHSGGEHRMVEIEKIAEGFCHTLDAWEDPQN